MKNKKFQMCQSPPPKTFLRRDKLDENNNCNHIKNFLNSLTLRVLYDLSNYLQITDKDF